MGGADTSSGSEAPRREPLRVFGSSLEMEALERMDSSRLLRLPSYREGDEARIETSEDSSFSPICGPEDDELAQVSTAASAPSEKPCLDAVRRSYDQQIALLVESWERDVRRADDLQDRLRQGRKSDRSGSAGRGRDRSASRTGLRDRSARRDWDRARSCSRGRDRGRDRSASAETPRDPRKRQRRTPKAKDKRSPLKRHARQALQSGRLKELGQGYVALHGENAELKAKLAAAERALAERDRQPGLQDRLERWALLGLVFLLVGNNWLSVF